MDSNVIAIMGPTASGKSALALALAQKYHGEIINFDSMQLYQGLSLITACPSAKDYQRAPHHLYEFQSVAKPLNAAAWAVMAAAVIKDCHQRGVLPILAGGTGFYLKTLMEGISPIADVDPIWVQQLTERAQIDGISSLHKELHKVDPDLAAVLKDHDAQRIIRALSVFYATKKPLSHWQKLPLQPFLSPDIRWKTYGIYPERTQLYRRCDQRFDLIMQKGALQEVKVLKEMDLPKTLPSMRAVGVRQLLGYLDGEFTLQEAIHKAKQATRNYAKRQLTWVRNSLKDAYIIEDFGASIIGNNL